MIAESTAKVKKFLKENRNDLLLASLVFFVGAASFGLGRLSVIWPEKEPVVIENSESRIQNLENDVVTAPPHADPDSGFHILDSPHGVYVASRNGSSYHLPACPGALRIKAENRVWFQTKEAAERAGYRPAGNCPDL